MNKKIIKMNINYMPFSSPINSVSTFVKFSKTVRNLIVMLDSTLSFKSQFDKIHKTVNEHISILFTYDDRLLTKSP